LLSFGSDLSPLGGIGQGEKSRTGRGWEGLSGNAEQKAPQGGV